MDRICTGFFVLAALMVMMSSGHATGLVLTGNARWIVLASRTDVDEAIGIARYHQWQLPSVRVVRAANGWFAVIAGPEQATTPRSLRDRLAQAGDLPKDFLLSRGDNYIAQVWAPARPSFEEVEYDGRRDNLVPVGDLAVTLSSATPKGGTERHPVAVGRQAGRVSFVASLNESKRTAEDDSDTAFAKLKTVALDPASRRAELVFTSFWGGAHCCTVVQILSEDARTGRWRVIKGETLDGGGYAFEDLDGDGHFELLSGDNSFLYAFGPYSNSNTPTRISQVRNGSLNDVTHDPTFVSYLRQRLAMMEHAAGLDPDRWRDNSFLAGWVAQSSLLGRREAAWARMLTLYNRNDDWTLEACTINKPLAECPEQRRRKIDFPTALRRHLDEHGYGAAPRSGSPSTEVSVEAPSGPRAAPSPQIASRAPTPSPEPAPNSAPQAPPPKIERKVSAGTGFFVTAEGHFVSNAHVIDECGTVRVKTDDGAVQEALILAKDAANDLALLKLPKGPGKFAALRPGIRLGEGVAAFGFPHTDLLSTSGNFTLGNVTALAGLGDDVRYVQMSAPVQSGNSGGPLLDSSGNLVGVVTAKLNALRVALRNGDLPQNVNFAVKAAILSTFLDANRVGYATGAIAAKALDPADLADQAKAMSGFVVCR